MLRLKEVLKEKSITGKELADRVGVTPASISNISNGNHFPKPELLKQIAQELDVDVRELFIPTKEKETQPIFIEKDGAYVKVGEILKDLEK